MKYLTTAGVVVAILAGLAQFTGFETGIIEYVPNAYISAVCHAG